MLEKPDLPDETLIARLQAEYRLNAVQVDFLPLGADQNTAVYRVVAEDQTPYFLKLRGGIFDETAVELPKFLHEQGILQVIAPLATQTGQLWADLEAYKLILYPFVDGYNGYEISLSDRQWIEFGTALKRIHSVAAPPALRRRIQQETFSAQWRETVKKFMGDIEAGSSGDAISRKLAAFLNARREEIFDLVGRAERLARSLQSRPLEFIVCHSDIHAGNILIGTNGAFYIVDWDNPILAPKERDLMFIGGGQGFSGHTPQEEVTLFYQGYGRQTQIDQSALAYYRYERIVQDIAAFCDEIFLSEDGDQDREQSLHYLESSFLPNHAVDIAYRSDHTGSMQLF